MNTEGTKSSHIHFPRTSTCHLNTSQRSRILQPGFYNRSEYITLVLEMFKRARHGCVMDRQTLTWTTALVLLLVTLVRKTNADCECGYSYSINSTTHVFTELLESDFLHLANISLDTDWTRQGFNITPAVSRGPYGESLQISNVISNPLSNNFSYSGPSQLGGDAGLQLYVMGGIPNDGLVPVAEVDSVREDMQWGSYRAAMKLTLIPGTCGAFFWVCFQGIKQASSQKLFDYLPCTQV